MAKEVQREVLWQAGAGPHPLQGEAGKPWWAKLGSFLRPIFSKFGLVSLADQVLVSVGLGTALASAGFAAIMIASDHPSPVFGGIEHLMLFAQPLHGRSSSVVARVQNGSDADGIDYSATGTIRPINPPPADKSKAGQLPATEPIVKAYVLQEADIDAAVVQGRGTAYRVRPGNFLPGAGRVLSIEQREDKWVVVTTQGVIVERPPPR